MWVSGLSVSISWFMRGMAMVTTFITWVSPRWNRPVPCAVGSTPTSLLSGRRSRGPRPSMRRPSSTIRLRTSLLGEAADGFLDLALAAGERGALAAQLRDGIGGGGVGGGVALGLGADGDGLGDSRRWRSPATASKHVLAVVELRRCTSSARSGRGWRRRWRRADAAGRCDSLIHVLQASRPPARAASSTFGAPAA